MNHVPHSSASAEDEAIIRLYFARDEQAITETARRFGVACLRLSMNILESHPDAEECVNDTYLHIWNAIPPTRPRSLGAFVLRVARNLSISRLREMNKASRGRHRTVPLDELEDFLPAREESSAELGALLSAFLDTLEARDRRLFLGRYWYGLRVKDLAAEWGMTPNAATQSINKTKERLRAYLTKGGYTV